MDIQQLSMRLIKWGNSIGAQDIYMLPGKNTIQLFVRRGNQRITFRELSQEDGEKLILHFKFLAEMDVGEKRKAQVGAITYKIADKEQRLRLSTVGDFKQRESLVIRLLHQFGYSPEYYFLPNQLREIRKNVQYHGLHLFCGPVGSGKTTLMYKLAKQTDLFQQIITIEDPVEIEEDSFLQLQINAKIQLTYDVLIKACLRHRPDIIMIGEIRDAQTAEAAVRAALTGHTIFATIHARSITGVYERLQDLGINKSELIECVSSVIYQRLLPCCGSKEGVSGVLMDVSFSKNRQSRWTKELRKVWAYGFIDTKVFEREQRI